MTVTTNGADIEALRQRFQAGMQTRLPEHLGRMTWSAERIAEQQRAGLRRLLAHAMAHSPFHARRLAGVDAGRFEPADLRSLPVMTKADMMADFDDVVTDRAITREAVERHIARMGELPEPLAGKYICLASGGSSGTRGVFCLDCEAAVEMGLAVLRPTIARMLTAGPPPGGPVIGFVTAPAAVHATRVLSALNDGGAMRLVHAPATLPLGEIVARLNAGRPNVIVGYPGMLLVLAGERSAGRLTIAPQSIASTSENLTAEAAVAIEEAFGVGVSNTFGSSEGLMGVANPGEDSISLASDLVIVELVDAENRPVPAGAPSDKVLITNLYNLAQPLIRYELSDCFVQRADAPDHGHMRVTVEGRSDESLVYDFATVHPLVIRGPMVKTPEVTEYQVRQTPRGGDVDVVVNAPIDERGLAERIATSLAAAGLRDPQVTVRTVAAIDRNPQTGKARRFVPLAAGSQR